MILVSGWQKIELDASLPNIWRVLTRLGEPSNVNICQFLTELVVLSA